MFDWLYDELVTGEVWIRVQDYNEWIEKVGEMCRFINQHDTLKRRAEYLWWGLLRSGCLFEYIHEDTLQYVNNPRTHGLERLEVTCWKSTWEKLDKVVGVYPQRNTMKVL